MHFELGQKIIDKVRGKNNKNVKTLQKELDELKATVEYLYSKGGNCYMPVEYKRRTIVEYAQAYNCNILIETGTYLGDTTDAVKDYFEKLYTIELSESLYKKAQKKFQGSAKICCYQGNSKDVLKEILPKVDGKIIFWLDAHYSGGITAKDDKQTPILEELDLIFKENKKSVILIDDAREFGTSADYPTLFNLKHFILKTHPNAEIEIYNDIIRVVL